MTIKHSWLALGRQAVFWAIASAFLASVAALDSPARAESSEPPSLETIKSSLDAIESAPVDNPGTSKRPGTPGVQFVGMPQFQEVGNQCTVQFLP